MTQIEMLSVDYNDLREVLTNLQNAASLAFGPSFISVGDLKAAFFVLTRVELNEDIYMSGYGGQNYGYLVKVGYSTIAYYGTKGTAGYNYFFMHEAVHNTVNGRAILQQMYDRHLLSGGNPETYNSSSINFIEQEQMTNLLTKQLADQIGVSVEPSPSQSNWPTYGYYSGLELNPAP